MVRLLGQGCVAAVLIVALSCGAPGGPSSLATPTPILVISPAFQDLPDGSAVTLSAVIVTGSSVSPVATVSWSSDATDVVSVDGQGRARALALGKATIRATSERMSATREMRVVPDYSGTWKGTYRVTSCRQSSIQGPSYCRF